MASKILVFLHLFGPRIPRTSTVLNSWATVCLWRRYLKYDEENDERKEIESSQDNNVDHHVETVEGSSRKHDFVRNERARRELSEFKRSTSSCDYKSRSQHVDEQSHGSNLPSTMPSTTPPDGLDHPDLRVNGMFLPQ